MKIFNYIYLFLTLVICTSFNSTAKAQQRADLENDLHTEAPSGSLSTSTCGVALNANGQVIDDPVANYFTSSWLGLQ